MTDSVQIGWLHVLSSSKIDFYHKLWYCEQDPPPRRFDAHSKSTGISFSPSSLWLIRESAVNQLCTLGHEMRKGKLFIDNRGRRGVFGQKYRDVDFTLSILLGSASLKFFVKYHDGEVARCNAKYREDKDR
jgi:hypothetical protein